jgi:uncharacterized damage-inducible protein DinB
MTEGTERRRVRLVLEPTPDTERDIGLALVALEDTRKRTRRALRGLPDDLIDSSPPAGGSTVGDLLYHVAAIEADWLFDDILGTIDTDWPKALFPMDVRHEDGTLSVFSGESLAEHLSRLEKVRAMLVRTLNEMSLEDFHRPRVRGPYDTSPAWVVHHLMQHEAEHRSQIGAIRAQLEGNNIEW